MGGEEGGGWWAIFRRHLPNLPSPVNLSGVAPVLIRPDRASDVLHDSASCLTSTYSSSTGSECESQSGLSSRRELGQWPDLSRL